MFNHPKEEAFNYHAVLFSRLAHTHTAHHSISSLHSAASVDWSILLWICSHHLPTHNTLLASGLNQLMRFTWNQLLKLSASPSPKPLIATWRMHPHMLSIPPSIYSEGSPSLVFLPFNGFWVDILQPNLIILYNGIRDMSSIYTQTH